MKFNEDSRVKIPTLLHLTRLGYTYLSLKDASWDISNLPKQNAFVSFTYNNQQFYISLSDYKIEFSSWSDDWNEDEESNKSNFETIEQYCFLNEVGGYIDISGSFDWFREELLEALKNVSADEISISDEE